MWPSLINTGLSSLESLYDKDREAFRHDMETQFIRLSKEICKTNKFNL